MPHPDRSTRSSRRRFLRLAATAPFAFSLRAGLPCLVPPNQLTDWEHQFRFDKASDFQPHSSIRYRPLWSELSEPDRKRCLKLLAIAYGKLKQKSDPNGSLYQTWVHDLFCRAKGQVAMPGAPSSVGTDVHWNYFFLPWHRAFLFFHERILQEQLDAKDAEDFRIPVYDWDTHAGAELPWRYKGLPVIDIGCKPLQDKPEEKPFFNECELQSWLISTSVAEFAGSSAHGLVVSSMGMHNDVHKILGSVMEDMSSAAADPVFWAHHGNVDRFWDFWAGQYASEPWFKSQYHSLWPNGYFYFYDRGSKPVRISIHQMLETEQLGYRYKKPALDITGFQTAVFSFVAPVRDQIAYILTQVLQAANPVVARIEKLVPAGLSPLLSVTEKISETVFSEILDSFQMISEDVLSSLNIPSRIIFSPDSIQPEYYFVDIQDQANKAEATIGGFSVMDHGDGGEHHSGTGHPMPVVVTCCVKAPALLLIANAIQAGHTKALRLVYGKPNAQRNGISGTRYSFPPVVDSIIHLPYDVSRLLNM